jgi:hypothetical protein
MMADPAPLGQGAALPSFEARDLSGCEVRSRRLLGALSITLFLAGDGSLHSWLQHLPQVAEQVAAWGGTLRVVAAVGRDAAERTRQQSAAPIRVVLDESGDLHRRMRETDAQGRPRPALLIFERGGILRCRVGPESADEDLEQALEWIRYLGIREPECGTCVPAWPRELLGEDAAL